METRWEWKLGDTWKPYDSVIDKAMTSVYNSGAQLMEVQINNVSYIIDFKSMRQMVKSDSKRWRRIRKVQAPRPVKSVTTTIVVDNKPQLATNMSPIQAEVVYSNGQPFASTSSGLVPMVTVPTPQGSVFAIDNGSGTWVRVEPLVSSPMANTAVYQGGQPATLHTSPTIVNQTGMQQPMQQQPMQQPQAVFTPEFQYASPQMAAVPQVSSSAYSYSRPLRIPDSPPDLRY